jgi:hypothetical protein
MLTDLQGFILSTHPRMVQQHGAFPCDQQRGFDRVDPQTGLRFADTVAAGITKTGEFAVGLNEPTFERGTEVLFDLRGNRP